MGAPVGNTNRKSAKKWRDSLTRALARASEGAGFDAGLDRVADHVVTEALRGERWAIEEIGNRIDGKPAQAIVGDDDLPPVRFQKIERVIVSPSDTDS